ncbi:MAG: metallophosphoesterase, partial [Polyangiaceae bacterium]|nr:metallophosphoesterase [Polyangiaceae bacterium]
MDAKRREDCGSGELTDRGLAAFRRMPYLQQLDSTGTSVLFTVGEGAVVSDALELVLTTPDGQPAGSAEVAPDGALAAAGTVPFRGRADGLSPATLYCYQVFEGDEPLTERAGFYTAPESGDTTTKFGFIAMGDTGGATEDQRSVLSQMFTVSHELVVHVGDLAYGNGTFDEFDRKHFAMYESLFNIVPHFPAPGNHDYGTDGGAAYLSVFELPENGNPSDPERYYSFDYGPIHFVSLDTNRLDDTQEAWLESDLAATDQPFVLVLGHHPPFSSGDHGSDRKVRARIVPH